MSAISGIILEKALSNSSIAASSVPPSPDQSTRNTHTPGPWTWGDKFRGLYGSGASNEVLSWYSYEGMHLVQGDTEANARLIAAAPDLLEACERLLVCMDLAGWSDDHTARCGLAAIAKATGASSAGSSVGRSLDDAATGEKP